MPRRVNFGHTRLPRGERSLTALWSSVGLDLFCALLGCDVDAVFGVLCRRSGAGPDSLIVLVDRGVRPLIILGQHDSFSDEPVLGDFALRLRGNILPKLELFVVLEHFSESHVILNVLLFRQVALLGHV